MIFLILFMGLEEIKKVLPHLSKDNFEELQGSYGVNDSNGVLHAHIAQLKGISPERFKRVLKALQQSKLTPFEKNEIVNHVIYSIEKNLDVKFKKPAFGLLITLRKEKNKNNSDSEINRISSIEMDLEKESPLNAYHVEDRNFLLKAFSGFDEVRNDPIARSALETSIKTSIPFNDLYKSIKDFDNSAEKMRFLDSVETLTDRVLKDKGIETAKRISLKTVKAFRKVKNDSVARNVFEASMKTGADFNDLFKTVKNADGGLVKSFENLRSRALEVFPESVVGKLNAKAVIRLGSDLDEKTANVLKNDENLKRFFLLTRGLYFDLPVTSGLGVKSSGYPFIKTDDFIKLNELGRDYGIPFKNLVTSYGKDKKWVKRNLNLVWSDIKPRSLKPIEYADLMQKMRGLKVKDLETGWVAFNKGVKPEDYKNLESRALEARIHPFVLVEAFARKQRMNKK